METSAYLAEIRVTSIHRYFGNWMVTGMYKINELEQSESVRSNFMSHRFMNFTWKFCCERAVYRISRSSVIY